MSLPSQKSDWKLSTTYAINIPNGNRNDPVKTRQRLSVDGQLHLLCRAMNYLTLGVKMGNVGKTNREPPFEFSVFKVLERRRLLFHSYGG